MMRRQKRFTYFLLCFLLVVPSPRLFAQRQGGADPREQLRQYVAQLQENPDDQNLREKIIKLALTIKPAPAIPNKDKVLELEGEARGALKTAQTQADYSDAVKLFRKALLLAPWDAALNYNLAKAQEMAKQYDDAMVSYKLYLLAAPDAKDHDAVLEKLGELKFEAKQSSPEAIAERNAQQAQASAEKKQQEEAEFLRSLDGAQYSCWNPPRYRTVEGWWVLNIRGKDALLSSFQPDAYHHPPPGYNIGHSTVTGRQFQMKVRVQTSSYLGFNFDKTFTISADGSEVILDPDHFVLMRQTSNSNYSRSNRCSGN